MTTNMFVRCLTAAIMLAGCLAGAHAASAQQELFHRWVSVEVRLTDSPKLYNGSYQDISVGRMCGETDPMQWPAGHMYIVETPLDFAGGQLTDFTFHSKTLVGAVKETASFFVSVNVTKAGVGGTPPAYVVDTERPAPSNSGAAQREKIDGGTKITIKGTDSLSQGIEATVICWDQGKEPKPVEIKRQ